MDDQRRICLYGGVVSALWTSTDCNDLELCRGIHLFIAYLLLLVINFEELGMANSRGVYNIGLGGCRNLVYARIAKMAPREVKDR